MLLVPMNTMNSCVCNGSVSIAMLSVRDPVVQATWEEQPIDSLSGGQLLQAWAKPRLIMCLLLKKLAYEQLVLTLDELQRST